MPEQERGAEPRAAVRAADPEELAREVALAVAHRAAKALTPAQSRAAELSSEELGQAHPEAEGHAEVVPAAWVRAAPAA